MAKEPQTVKDYASLGYDKLHKELLKMVQQSERSTVWFNTDKQLRLLPALTAMRGLVGATRKAVRGGRSTGVGR